MIAMVLTASFLMYLILDLNQRYLKHSAIAMVNGKPWHMLQPLIEDCELRFVTMKDDDVREANQVCRKDF